LLKLAPQLIMYGMSLLTLGIFWVGQQTQLNQFARAYRHIFGLAKNRDAAGCT